LRKNRDNFKTLVEGIIEESGCEFVMFSTDDSILYRDTFITDDILEMIRGDPYQVSYRLYVGSNLKDAPASLQRVGNLLAWDYYDKAMYHHWAYPFAVDGTVYSASALLDIIRGVLYHNPSTLEAFVCKEIMVRKLFRRGFSPLESTMVGLPINRVSSVARNFSGDIDVALLNQKFLEGYTLEYELPHPVNQNALLPQKVIISRGAESIDLAAQGIRWERR
jgi:hypothetical protein